MPQILPVSVLAVVVGLASAQTQVQAQEDSPRLAAEEKAVYETVIRDILKHPDRVQKTQIAIRAETTTDRAGSSGPDRVQALAVDPVLRTRFSASNKTPHLIPTTLKLPVPYVAQGFDLSPRDFWQQFYKRYPGSAGIVGLSRVAFTDDFAHALVYREHIHGDRTGQGEYLLLSRGANGWVIDKEFPSWIS
jgi:hypothetical protein